MLAFVEATQRWCAQAGVAGLRPFPAPEDKNVGPPAAAPNGASPPPPGFPAVTADPAAPPAAGVDFALSGGTRMPSPLLAPLEPLPVPPPPLELEPHGSPGGRSGDSDDGTASYNGWEDLAVESELDE